MKIEIKSWLTGDIIYSGEHENIKSAAEAAKANLCVADLRGANLREADLSGANLSGAALRETDINDKNITTTYTE